MFMSFISYGQEPTGEDINLDNGNPNCASCLGLCPFVGIVFTDNAGMLEYTMEDGTLVSTPNNANINAFYPNGSIDISNASLGIDEVIFTFSNPVNLQVAPAVQPSGRVVWHELSATDRSRFETNGSDWVFDVGTVPANITTTGKVADTTVGSGNSGVDTNADWGTLETCGITELRVSSYAFDLWNFNVQSTDPTCCKSQCEINDELRKQIANAGGGTSVDECAAITLQGISSSGVIGSTTETQTFGDVCGNIFDVSFTDTNTQLTESQVDAFVANNGYYDNCTDIANDCGFITTDENTEYKFDMSINNDCEIEFDFISSDGSTDNSGTLPLPQTTFDYDDCVFYINNGCGQELKIDNRQTFVYEAEDSDNLTDNRFNHSIGNGNELNGLTANDWGFVVPYDGQIVSVTMGNRTTVTTDSEFQLTLDSALAGNQLVLPANTSSIVWNTNVNVTAGQSINFYTIDGNNISDSAITIYYKACTE